MYTIVPLPKPNIGPGSILKFEEDHDMIMYG